MDILRDHGFLLTSTSASINVNLGADIFLGVTLILCFIVGVPANLISFKFFVSKPKPKDLCTCIYMLITLSDVIICTMTLVPAVSYLNERSPKLFSLSWVCRGWGAFLAVFPAFSIFTLSLLSVTRTYNVRRPLRPMKRKGCLRFLVAYFLLLVALQAALVVGGKQRSSFNPSHVFCSGSSSSDSWQLADTVVRTVELALPIPISLVSAVVSTVEVIRFMKRGSARSILLKRHATVTIILITVIFLILNLPAFIVYLLKMISMLDGSDVFTNTFMKNYSWGITRVVLYSMNAMLNPIIYLLRIRHYRTWIAKNSGELTRKISSLGARSFNNVSPMGLERAQSSVALKTRSVVIVNRSAASENGSAGSSEESKERSVHGEDGIGPLEVYSINGKLAPPSPYLYRLSAGGDPNQLLAFDKFIY